MGVLTRADVAVPRSVGYMVATKGYFDLSRWEWWVCIATLLFVGARKLGASEPAASIGVLVAFVQYIQRFFEPLRDISSKFTIMQSAMAAAERIFSLLDKPEPDAPTRELSPGASPERVAGADFIEFRDVRFGYTPDRPTLKGVSFSVEKGRSVALVGSTGAGKVIGKSAKASR